MQHHVHKRPSTITLFKSIATRTTITIATAAKTSLVALRSCVRYAGIITEATLKIHKIPAYSNSVRVSFGSIDAAAKTVQDTLAVRDVLLFFSHIFLFVCLAFFLRRYDWLPD